jgi:uncharacterized membrane protein
VPTQSKLLTNKLRALGRTLVLTELSRRLVVAITAAILLLAALVLTDVLLELPLETRKVLFTIAAAITGILLLRALITPVTQHRDDEELALLSEQKHPEFDSRLISAIQFAKGKVSGASRPPEESGNPVMASMVSDTEGIAQGTNLLDAVDPRFLARALLAFVIIAALATTAFFAFQKLTPTLVKRAFLQDIAIPRDTQITSTTGDLKVGIGDLIELSATAEGVLPAEATLRVKFASGRKLDYPLTKTESTYTVEIEDVPESFTYQFRINDARSAGSNVDAFARPEIGSLTATQTYPDYTGIEPSEHQPGDFYLFPGGQFKLQLNMSKPLAEGTLRLIGLEKELPIDVATNTVEFEIPTEGLTGFSITMLDTDGMEAKEPAVYRAELLGDEPPKVRITFPTRSEELVTKTARSLMAFEVTDRFGIASVSLNFSINEGDPRSQELEFPAPENGKAPTSLKHQYEWELKTIEPPLKVGDVIEYWITAQDRQRLTLGIGESEHLRLRIVSVADKRRDLLSRASDYLGGVGATTEDQQRLNTDLGDLIRAKD